MKPRHGAAPHKQARPLGPALGGPYCQVSSSPAATMRLVTSSIRGSSEPVRLQAGLNGAGHAFRARRLERSMHGSNWKGACNGLSHPEAQSCSPSSHYPPAQHHPEVAAIAAVVEEAPQVPTLRCINVQPHRGCTAGQPLAQHLHVHGPAAGPLGASREATAVRHAKWRAPAPASGPCTAGRHAGWQDAGQDTTCCQLPELQMGSTHQQCVASSGCIVLCKPFLRLGICYVFSCILHRGRKSKPLNDKGLDGSMLMYAIRGQSGRQQAPGRQVYDVSRPTLSHT